MNSKFIDTGKNCKLSDPIYVNIEVYNWGCCYLRIEPLKKRGRWPPRRIFKICDSRRGPGPDKSSVNRTQQRSTHKNRENVKLVWISQPFKVSFDVL